MYVDLHGFGFSGFGKRYGITHQTFQLGCGVGIKVLESRLQVHG